MSMDYDRRGRVTIIETLLRLSQTGTDAPVATILENTLGEMPVWEYDGVGEFLMSTAAPILVEEKTFIVIGSPLTANDNQAQAVWQSTTGAYVATFSGGTPGNGFLNNTAFEIRVYP